jgi:signal transduction histidine kinase
LPAPVETTLFRIAQEALHNVTKHAGATSLHIRLDFSLKDAVLEIEDNGRGFDSESVLSQAGQPHWGLISMQQRAESIGGTFCIETSPGQGTLLTVKVSRNCDDH